MSNQTVHFKNIREKIIETLETANSEVLIAVAWFTDDKIIKVLNDLSLKGVDISIIFYEDRINNKDLFKTLYYRRAELKVSKKLMHNKFCIIDREIVINGSYNWTYSATNNDENIQITRYNEDLVNSFIEEFYKLKMNCKNFDNHFKYSLEEVLKVETDFKLTYKEISGKHKYPYFRTIKHFNANSIHNSIKMNNSFIDVKKEINGYVLINDEKDEFNLFRYLYYLKKDYLLSEIAKITLESFKFPSFYYNIIGLNKNNEVNRVDKLSYTIEEPVKSYNNVVGDVYLINNKGDIIGNKIRYSEKLKNGFYKIGVTGHSILDYDLNEIVFNGSMVAFFENLGILSQYYVKKINCYKYGFTDFNSNILVDFKYENYKIIDKNFIEFHEYPICYSKYSEHYGVEIVSPYYSNKSVCYKIHLFNMEKKEIVITDKILESTVKSHYFFKSDEEYKFELFYKECYDANISLKVFTEIKQGFGNIYGLNNKKQHANFLRKHYGFRLISLKEQKKANQKSCYIATMVYEDINHPKVELLRQFRDDVLNEYFLGRGFIKYYYQYSPRLVENLKNYKKINFLIKIVLDLIIKIIK